MKKKIFAFVLIVLTFASCDSAKNMASGAYNMINCNYSYKSISDMKVSGMSLSSGLSVTNIAKVSSILGGNASSIPLDFTLNLNVNNPNQSAASLSGMQYIISIDDIQFTTGTFNQAINIGAGQTQVIPLAIGVDLATLMRNNSKDAVVDIAKNLIGIGSKESKVSVQLKPTFMLGDIPITSPMYIPVSFSFGGK